MDHEYTYCLSFQKLPRQQTSKTRLFIFTLNQKCNFYTPGGLPPPRPPGIGRLRRPVLRWPAAPANPGLAGCAGQSCDGRLRRPIQDWPAAPASAAMAGCAGQSRWGTGRNLLRVPRILASFWCKFSTLRIRSPMLGCRFLNLEYGSKGPAVTDPEGPIFSAGAAYVTT